MSPLQNSRPVRVYFEHASGTRSYDLTNHAVLATVEREEPALDDQMSKDGICHSMVREFIDQWRNVNRNIEDVCVTFRSGMYFVLVHAAATSREEIRRLHVAIEPIRDLFADNKPMISIVPPLSQTNPSWQ